MVTHSSILAWEIPWTLEPSGLQFMESQKVSHDCATNTFMLGGTVLHKPRNAAQLHPMVHVLGILVIPSAQHHCVNESDHLL